MITVEFLRMMARYNQWQNQSLYGAAHTLDDAARRLDRGAFFQSIHGTLSHLYWGDSMWMHRFAGLEKPLGGIRDSAALINDWQELKHKRAALDQAIIAWAESCPPSWLEGDLAWYSGAVQRDMRVDKKQVAVHFFNHQTHHRGQVHAMLTAAGAKPDDTDFMLMPAVR